MEKREEMKMGKKESWKEEVKNKKGGIKNMKEARKEIKEQPIEQQQVVENKKEGGKQMEKYLEQKVYRHYYVDKSKLKNSNGLPFGDLFGTIWHPEIKIGEVVIHFVDEEKSNIFEEIKTKDVVINKERNSSEIFEESKIIKEMKGELGGVDYVMVVAYRAMALAGLSRHLLEIFKELTVPMAQDILNKKVRKDKKESLLMRISKRYLDSSEKVQIELKEKAKKEEFNSVLGYIWYTECQNEESPIGEILLLLYGEEFKSLNFDDPKLWKVKLGRRVYEGEKPSVTYESIQEFYSGNPEELFPLDKENEEQNNKVTTQIQLPVVIKFKDRYKVTKFLPNSVKINEKNIAFPFSLHRIISGLRKQVVTTAFAEMQKRNLEGINSNGKNLIMVLYKLIDLDDLINDYPIYKEILISWFNMSIEPSNWFKSYRKFVTNKSVFGYFSPDMSSKNNPLGLVAPACNIPGYEHLSWLGLAINPLEAYTGDHGKRMVGNAVIKAFPVNISKMPGNIYKTKVLQEQLLTGSMMWELVVDDFEGNFTSIGEGALITKWGKEKIEEALEGKVEKGQPFKPHNDTSGEKSLTQAFSKVALIYYHGTKIRVFKGALSDENVAIIRAYNKRRNFISVNCIGRERANKVLRNKPSFKPIYVDAYDEKGELIYEKAELVLQKVYLDVTLDRRPMIVMQNNSSVQQEVLTFDMGKTKLPYQKYKEETEKRNKEAKDILFSAYYYLSRGRISINEHKVPELKKHPEKKLYVLDENNLKELRKNGIIFHGKRFFLPSYSTYIEGIGIVANDILTYVVNMSKRQASDNKIGEKQIKMLLDKIQGAYERLSQVRIPMVRSRLAIMKNLGLKSMVVSPHVLELLIEDNGDKRALEVLKAVGPKEFLKYYNIEVYGVRFPDFGYSGDYRIVAVDSQLFETVAVSTLNAALIGGDVDDDTISLKIVSMTPKGKLPPSPDNKKEILLQKLLEEEKKFLGEKVVKEDKKQEKWKKEKKNILENNQLEDEPLNKEVINMEKETKEPNVEFYVDGSYNSKADKVGYAYVGLIDGNLTFKGSAVLSNKAGLRNVFGEITAAYAAVIIAKKHGYSRIKIYYDYSGVEEWVTGNWKAKNQITQNYARLMRNSGVSIEFVKVKAHSGNKWNEVVDEMARKATLMPTTNSIQSNKKGIN
ncbi:MAG: ribonuclease H-related protein [Thermosipho sp. (in: thermotogales)]|nr:ribonuclease H-related protein [Thermosipho sp. (in: thermotogales)]